MNKSEREKFLAELIKADTAGGFEDRVALLLGKAFKKHKINFKLIPLENGRSDFYAQIGEKKGKVLAFTGHQDVVKPGDAADWKFPPFSAHVENGKMFGRGAADMKSGLAAMSLAMMELVDEKVALKGELKFLGTVGEESSKVNHMQGAQRFSSEGYVDDIDALVVGEPTDGNIIFTHKGSVTYEVDSKGLAAHSSTPEKGYDAIKPLVRFYELQEKYFETLTEKNKYLRRTTPVVTRIEGGEQLNSVPDKASMFVKIRTIPEIPNKTIFENAEKMIKQINQAYGAKLSLKILGDKASVFTNPQDDFINFLDSLAREKLTKRPKLLGISGDTDASEMTKVNSKMAVAVFGPGSETSHQINEYVDLNQFNNFVDLYKSAAKKYLGVE
ncbi:ArgE/DapE family deacylase [Liquorilactobacillus mali]|uniref:ArgE/DapE family deacylase n=1 Tax=Liquorilactobacillus mali TaxID=1618 RepID=UPI002350F0AA|nr:ArgE/DapE family deacylase [Liquorilactobacillus mali]MDC7952882.1 ArgE/DapE family deacylase [Liquorilactobacillus mali]